MFKAILLGQWHSLSDHELEEINNRQLMSRGLMLKGANGAVIDATLIESAVSKLADMIAA